MWGTEPFEKPLPSSSNASRGRTGNHGETCFITDDISYLRDTYVSPGDLFPKAQDPADPNRSVFPTGTEVTDWMGKEVRYMDIEAVRSAYPSNLKMIDWTTGTDFVDEADIFRAMDVRG